MNPAAFAFCEPLATTGHGIRDLHVLPDDKILLATNRSGGGLNGDGDATGLVMMNAHGGLDSSFLNNRPPFVSKAHFNEINVVTASSPHIYSGGDFGLAGVASHYRPA